MLPKIERREFQRPTLLSPINPKVFKLDLFTLLVPYRPSANSFPLVLLSDNTITTMSAIFLRQSRLIVRSSIRNASSATETAQNAATKAKETAQNVTSKASQGLTKVTSSASETASSAASSVTGAAKSSQGRIGSMVSSVQGK